MKILYTILIFVFVSSCTKDEPKAVVLQGNAFGTTYTIQYFSEETFETERGIDSVFYAVNKSVSTYMPNSDISKINRGDSTVVIDNIFKEVYEISEGVYLKSGGYFDPTIGVLRNAYGFGDVKPLEIIDSTTLDSLRQFVGFQKVTLTSENKIKKEHPEIYFDFNAVAKGYGIDCLGNYLETLGVDNYLIELGGEILAKGMNVAKGAQWVAGVENVDSNLEDRTYETVIGISNLGMASSGNYRKFRIDSLTGKRYVHTLNPLTGSAEKNDVTSATVLAPTCALADAYATTFMALGLERSKELLTELSNIEAYLTYTDDSNTPKVFMTQGFEKRVLK